MAHTILVRLELDDEYADIHPDIAAMDYLKDSKAPGWEVVTERVFTDSEVRALMGPMTSLARIVSQPDVIREVEYVEAQEVQQAFDELKAIVVRLGLYSDPA